MHSEKSDIFCIKDCINGMFVGNIDVKNWMLGTYKLVLVIHAFNLSYFSNLMSLVFSLFVFFIDVVSLPWSMLVTTVESCHQNQEIGVYKNQKSFAPKSKIT